MSDSLRGYTLTLNATSQLETETCFKCGVLFAMPADLMENLRKNRNSFFCPNGHSQAYTGKTKAEKLQDKLDAKERELERAERRRAGAEAREKMANNSLRATKGVVTKMKNRASKGICPCCNRHFVNVQRHMETQHPDFVTEEAA